MIVQSIQISLFLTSFYGKIDGKLGVTSLQASMLNSAQELL